MGCLCERQALRQCTCTYIQPPQAGKPSWWRPWSEPSLWLPVLPLANLIPHLNAHNYTMIWSNISRSTYIYVCTVFLLWHFPYVAACTYVPICCNDNQLNCCLPLTLIVIVCEELSPKVVLRQRYRPASDALIPLSTRSTFALNLPPATENDVFISKRDMCFNREEYTVHNDMYMHMKNTLLVDSALSWKFFPSLMSPVLYVYS